MTNICVQCWIFGDLFSCVILCGNEVVRNLLGLAAFFFDEVPFLAEGFGGGDGHGTETVSCFFELLLPSTAV